MLCLILLKHIFYKLRYYIPEFTSIGRYDPDHCIAIMREFSFLRADTALPRLLNKEDFADVEQIYRRVNTALASHSPVASYLGRYFKKYARMTTIEYRRKPGLNDAVITAVNKEVTTEILII